ncbi:hypothetical protein Rifp1Sym_fn00020 [endosymbiont of Riftia pachyptila (vent Ph05)]|uniref:Uncharacterized protein n=1 Tax=endosymbiont of Riftia pachyptila (vent Ph05) TaxID=1048808 RepID=G2DHP3_9GAMM|nr:hypothetical protein Rifp1Sym_fn00020 [endosymbiont of Riftia pachyptila (vent Ph05)]
MARVLRKPLRSILFIVTKPISVLARPMLGTNAAPIHNRRLSHLNPGGAIRVEQADRLGPQRKAPGQGVLVDTQQFAQLTLDVARLEQHAGAVELQGAWIDGQFLMAWAARADDPVGPADPLPHQQLAARRPVVLAVVAVVAGGAPHIRGDMHQQAVGQSDLFRLAPEVVEATGQPQQGRRLVVVMVSVGVETATAEDPGDAHAGRRHHQKQVHVAHQAAPVTLQVGGVEARRHHVGETGQTTATTTGAIEFIQLALPTRQVVWTLPLRLQPLQLKAPHDGDIGGLVEGPVGIPPVRIGHGAQQRLIRQPSEGHHPGGLGKTAGAHKRHRHPLAVDPRQQLIEAWIAGHQLASAAIALRRPVAVALQIDTIDHQHPLVVALKKLGILGERGITQITGAPGRRAGRPTIHRTVLPRITEGTLVPTATGMQGDQYRPVVGRRHPWPRPTRQHRCHACHSRQSQKLSSLHPSLLQAARSLIEKTCITQ